MSAKLTTLFAILLIVIGCENTDPIMKSFNDSDVGRALHQCFIDNGKIEIERLAAKDVKNIVQVKLEKKSLVLGRDKHNITLQFSVDPDSKRVGLVGGRVEGFSEINAMILSFEVALVCGNTLTAKILPDQIRSIQILRDAGVLK